MMDTERPRSCSRDRMNTIPSWTIACTSSASGSRPFSTVQACSRTAAGGTYMGSRRMIRSQVLDIAPHGSSSKSSVSARRDLMPGRRCCCLASGRAPLLRSPGRVLPQASALLEPVPGASAISTGRSRLLCGGSAAATVGSASSLYRLPDLIPRTACGRALHRRTRHFELGRDGQHLLAVDVISHRLAAPPRQQVPLLPRFHDQRTRVRQLVSRRPFRLNRFTRLGGRHLDPDSRTIASWDRSAQPASCAITTQPDRRGRQNLPSRPGPQHMGS